MKDYILIIKGIVEDCDIRYDKLIRVISCKDCTSKSDAIKRAERLLIEEGRLDDCILDVMFDDPDEVFFKIEVYPNNDGIIYSI